MTVADVIGVLRDHPIPFAVAGAFILILCTIVRHEYGKKGLPIMFFWLLGSVFLSAVGAWIEQTWGQWPARIYSTVLNTAIVVAIVVWTKKTQAAEKKQPPKSPEASDPM